jgi:DNA end-binding protein Ku
MPRAIWKGSISFGLVNIPVELYPAEDRKEFKFSMLDKRDFSPVGYKRYSKKSGKEVAWADIVKGYEYEADQYVVLSEEDFRLANAKASRTIDIESFVPSAEIPATYFDTPYFLAPRERGEKVYALLRETLKSAGKAAVAQFVLRTKQHLAAVVPSGKALMLITLRYENELRDAKDLELPAEGLKGAKVSQKEIELAKRLIADMSEKWRPTSFKDTYHDDLMKRIREKIKKGQTREITQPGKDDEPGERPTGKVIDLAALLKQSLGKGASRAGDEDETEEEAPARPKRAKGKPKLSIVHSTRQPAKAAAHRKRA